MKLVLKQWFHLLEGTVLLFLVLTDHHNAEVSKMLKCTSDPLGSVFHPV